MGDIKLNCRSVQLGQVLLNLLNNSFDAVLGSLEPWVRMTVIANGDFLQIRVTDSGASIDKEVVKKMMEPFFTTKGIGKGTGLGLSISKGIIEAHEGKFYFDHNVKNTCFVIELPYSGPTKK